MMSSPSVALLAISVVLLCVGVVRDVRASEQHKGTGGGPLRGTLRPTSSRGFRRGAPFYMLGAALLLLVAFQR